jgi:hypothetical protein
MSSRPRQPWEPEPPAPITAEQRQDAIERAMTGKPPAGPKTPTSATKLRQEAIERAMLAWISSQLAPPTQDLRPPFILSEEGDKTRILGGRIRRPDHAVVAAAREALRIRELFRRNRVPRSYDAILYAALRTGLPRNKIGAVANLLDRPKSQRQL